MADNITWFDRNIGFHVADAANWLVDDVLGVSEEANNVEYALVESRKDLDKALSWKSIEDNVILPTAKGANSLIEDHPRVSSNLVAWQNFWDESLQESDRYTRIATDYAFNYAVKPTLQVSLGLVATVFGLLNCIQRYDDFGKMTVSGEWPPDTVDITFTEDGQATTDVSETKKNDNTGLDIISEFLDQFDVGDIDVAGEDGSVKDTPNGPPVLTPIYNQEIEIGKYLNFTLTAQDPNNDTLTYYAENLPSGATLNSETGEFSWKPTNNQDGDYYVTFCVSDGEYNDCITIMIKVLPGFDLNAEIISVPSNGEPVNGSSRHPAMSYDGRYIVYYSNASNLTQGDTNSFNDIYIHDRQTGTTELITRGVDGQVANGDSQEPSISNDGQIIAFQSSATNLVWPNTTTFAAYLYDRNKDKIELVAENGGIGQVSANGQYVVFSSDNANMVAGDNNNTSDVFVYDRISKATTLASVTNDGIQGNYGSGSANIGYDNSVIVFTSMASNFFNEAIDDERSNVFLKNMLSGSIELVDMSWNGQAPICSCPGQGCCGSESKDVSDDGRFVLMESGYINLVPNDDDADNNCFVRDRQLSVTELVSLDEQNEPLGDYLKCHRISNDGRFVAFEHGYYNNLYIRDRLNGKTVFLNFEKEGARDPAFSGDGKWLAFDKVYEYEGVWDTVVMVVSMETLFDLNN